MCSSEFPAAQLICYHAFGQGVYFQKKQEIGKVEMLSWAVGIRQ